MIKPNQSKVTKTMFVYSLILLFQELYDNVEGSNVYSQEIEKQIQELAEKFEPLIDEFFRGEDSYQVQVGQFTKRLEELIDWLSKDYSGLPDRLLIIDSIVRGDFKLVQ